LLKNKNMQEEDLYPIHYKGVDWGEKDVHDVFAVFYHTRYALDEAMSVYVGEDMRITPDGEWIEL
jgi:hypothetical protein